MKKKRMKLWIKKERMNKKHGCKIEESNAIITELNQREWKEGRAIRNKWNKHMGNNKILKKNSNVKQNFGKSTDRER